MAFLISNNVCIKGISGCVPSDCKSTTEIYKWGNIDNFINTTGIKSRRIANKTITSSDLCYKAANRLIDELGWNKDEIDVLIFVTQTPDYISPATSPILQNKLGLSTTCYTLDISLGCSGWVYALSVITSLMQNGTMRKGLLLAGDTIMKVCSPKDKSTYPLFGDAGTATALQYQPDAPSIFYNFNSDGNGYNTIIIPDGGYRNPFNKNSLIYEDIEEGISRTPSDVILDGMSVFSFGITKAPKSIRQLSEQFKINIEDIDLYTFHQANMMMNEKIRTKLKLPSEKVPYCLDEFANTSCASIPLTLVTRKKSMLENSLVKHIACGFGVGLSWGSVYFETNQICIPKLIEI